MAISLMAYETALAITPKSFNARFNFALALRKSNYLIDAARELERTLVINPGESPSHLAAAHLMLASLYSDQFHQPQAARSHYAKVLELEPRQSPGDLHPLLAPRQSLILSPAFQLAAILAGKLLQWF